MKALAPGRASKDSSSSPSSCPPGCGHLSSASPSAARSLQLDVRADMNGCYDTLRRLVPTIPQDKKVSRVEILQHVIDYILELQRALDMQPALLRPPCGRCPSEAPRAPLVALNSVQPTLFSKATHISKKNAV